MLLKLFLTFFEIGAVSFGGGYGMISLVRETVLGHGWLTESEFLSFIAVSESTPGPLAANMATFIGASQAGLAGSFAATVGVVLPSFVIILLIAGLIVSLDGLDFTTNFTAALSCLSNVGPGLSLVGPTGSFAIFSPLSKIVLMICMLLGRLEIFPLLLLFVPFTWRWK